MRHSEELSKFFAAFFGLTEAGLDILYIYNIIYRSWNGLEQEHILEKDKGSTFAPALAIYISNPNIPRANQPKIVIHFHFLKLSKWEIKSQISKKLQIQRLRFAKQKIIPKNLTLICSSGARVNSSVEGQLCSFLAMQWICWAPLELPEYHCQPTPSHLGTAGGILSVR